MNTKSIAGGLLDFLAANVNTETELWPGAQFSCFAAPQRAGRMYRLRAGGVVDQAETGNWTIRVYYGPLTDNKLLGTFPVLSSDFVSWHLDVDVVVRLEPGSAFGDQSYVATAYGRAGSRNQAVTLIPTTPPPSIDPTVDSFLTVTVDSSANDDTKTGFVSLEELNTNP